MPFLLSSAAVGARLKRLRLRRGITLADLAAETGISASTLSRLEAALRRPTLEQLTSSSAPGKPQTGHR